MSRSWPDRLAFALAPEQVSLVRLAGLLRPRVVARELLPVVPVGDEAPWRAALARFAQGLGEARRWQRVRARGVLSNHFVRYQLVPWSDVLTNEAERLAYVREHFAQVYGEAARAWRLCLSATPPGVPLVAAATDAALIEGVEQALAAAGGKLVSLVPHWMSAFNGARAQIRERDAWFVQVESQRLLLGLVLAGNWRALASRRFGEAAAWPAELLALLEREVHLQGLRDAPRNVYLAAPEAHRAALEAGGRWTFHWLRAAPRPGFAGAQDAAFAMALGA